MAKLAQTHDMESIEMRKAYCDAMVNTAKNNDKIVVLDCDLSSSMGTKNFAKQFPNRAINCGIAEANACGVAAGLSATGFIPFVHSFAVFTSRRLYDQAFISCAYAGLNVKLIGGDAGVSAAVNGGTHMAFEDVGILRNIPGITILEASDSSMMKNIIPKIVEHYGVTYLRMPRKQVHKIYNDESTFEIGKAEVLKEGTDATVIASGLCVHEALCASDILRQEGINVRVVDMFTIKPIDRECIIESAKKTGAIVTAENHNIINGLGSAVAEVLVECAPVPMERVGVHDQFGEVGPQPYLMERFELTAKTICENVRRVISRKNK